MRRNLLILIVFITLQSCQTFHQYEAQCVISKERFVSDVTTLYISNRIEITTAIPESGLVKGTFFTGWYGLITFTAIWNNGQVIFDCHDGMNDYFDDKSKFELYRTIKKDIETMCQNTMFERKK